MAPGAIGIKVAMIARPWTMDDKAGVVLTQHCKDEGKEAGEVEMINSKYSTNRYGFTWCWYSGYNWKRHLSGEANKTPDESAPTPEDEAACENMEITGQLDKYDQCGKQVMKNLMDGDAVVLFAYGLSGSGKTFTVFGPDAVDAPEAWFKHEEPHDLWGIFPRLAYELFQKQEDGWKITMKYFQNIVDIVRDLMDPLGKEEVYKTGLRKDKDGFMDINWCKGKLLTSWKELRETFQEANARKAIAPTQFNHQSTRGHCIMVLEIEMPVPDDKSKKQKGRVYVCDLAGTEPAGDIVSARYEKKVFPDGSIEHKYIGPHDDKSKTKELQDQGKKINLSLSEMRQFFMKMAAAVKKKKLKAGASIPGCNSYFLCKFLKDTMLQSKTYLFCAIRPEATYLNYTRDTLNFGKDASVIKLKPKKATTATSKKEMALMQQLEEMKAMMAGLQEGAGKGGGVDEEEMQKMIKEKQEEMRREMMGDSEKRSQDEAEREKQKYAERGIELSTYAGELTCPYLENLDADPFRNKRFILKISGNKTVGREGADIRPINIHVVENHCSFEVDPASGAVSLKGGEGKDVYCNGEPIKSGASVTLSPGDRISFASEIHMFRDPQREKENPITPMEASDAADELHAAKMKYDEALAEAARQEQEAAEKAAQALEEEIRKLRAQGKTQEEIDEKKREIEMWKDLDNEMTQMVPVIKSIESVLEKLGRLSMIDLKLSLSQPKNDKPSIKVSVRGFVSAVELSDDDVGSNTEIEVFEKDGKKFSNAVEVYLAPFELHSMLGQINEQVIALTMDPKYVIPITEDVMSTVFDTSFHVGTSTCFLLHCSLLMETEAEDVECDVIKTVQVPLPDPFYLFSIYFARPPTPPPPAV